MTLTSRTRTADESVPAPAAPAMPSPAHADGSLEAILSDELKDLRKEVEELVKHGLSEDEAKGLLDWAQELEEKVRVVATILEDPSPANVSAYLRFVAGRIDTTKSRRFASSSLRLLRAALARAAH